MADTWETDGVATVRSASETTNTKLGFGAPSGEIPLSE